MAFTITKFLKGILIKEENTNTPKEIEITPGGTANTKTTITSSQSVNRTITTPDATTTLVGTDATQTITNKTIDADSNTITNIENADIKAAANIDLSKLASVTANRALQSNGSGVVSASSVSDTELGYVSGVTSAIQTQLNSKVDEVASTDNAIVRFDGVTGSIQNSTVTIDDSGNVVIPGDLTVNGTTVTLNTQTLDVEDQNITVNINGNDTSAQGAGITVNRTGTDGAVIYDSATASKFKAGDVGSEAEIATVSHTQTLTNKTIVAANNTITTAASGNLVSTELNAALDELQDSIDLTDTNLSNHISDTTTHGTTGNILGTSDAQVITNKDIDGGTASNTNRITLPKQTIANLTALTRKEGTVVYATDVDKVYYDDGASLRQVGSGASVNFLDNGDAEAGTTGWATYDDGTSQPRPSNGTAGTSSTLTFATTTSNPLSGTKSFTLTKSAADGQGEGVSYDFSIDNAAKGQMLSLTFDYIVNSGTFAAGSASTDSDVIAYIYDVTNSQLIEPSNFKLYASSTSIPAKFKANFQANSNSTSYRLILHVATASTAAYELKIDSVTVSREVSSYGTPVSDWKPFTPTGGWTGAVTYTGKYRRVGDVAEVEAYITTSGAPTGSSLTVDLSGIGVIDSNKIASGTSTSNYNLGLVTVEDAGTVLHTGVVAYTSTTSVMLRVLNVASTYATASGYVITPTVPFTFGSGDTITAKFTVPIVGWSSNVAMNTETSGRPISAALKKTANQTYSANATYQNITFVTTPAGKDAYDTANGWNGTNTYTVQEAGDYEISIRTQVNSTNVVAADYYVQIVAGGISKICAFQRAASPSLVLELNGETKLKLVAGDTITFRLYTTADHSINNLTINTDTYASIEKKDNNVAIAGESIAVMPTGSVMPYAGINAPYGYLMCYGQAVSRTSYSTLFAALSTTYGVGDGSTTFNLPDLRGRTIAGVDNMGGSTASRITAAESGITGTTLGSAGGVQSVTLTSAQSGVPAHTHTATQAAHEHTTNFAYWNSGSAGAGTNYDSSTHVAGGWTGSSPVTYTGLPLDTATPAITVNNNSTANAASSHSNTQPTIMLNYIIKT